MTFIRTAYTVSVNWICFKSVSVWAPDYTYVITLLMNLYTNISVSKSSNSISLRIISTNSTISWIFLNVFVISNDSDLELESRTNGGDNLTSTIFEL